jgi:hypothetical protein
MISPLPGPTRARFVERWVASMPDETVDPSAPTPATPPPDTGSAEPTLPPGMIHDPITGQLRPMTFMEKARGAASQAAKVGAVVGREAAKVGVEVGKEVGTKAATTIKDPATKARAQSALRKAKRGFTTALERIDPKILADVVIKATSLQERANASLQARGSVYRIGEIGIGAAIPPSITFTIERVDDPSKSGLNDSTTLLAQVEADGGAPETIVTLDGTAIDEATIDEVVAES